MAAAPRVAGRAGDVQSDNRSFTKVRAGAQRIRWAEERDEWRANRGGDVHGAAVVGDDELGAAQEFRELHDCGLAGETGRANLAGQFNRIGSAGDVNIL